MRLSALLCIVVTHAWTLRANVEKAVFLAPSPTSSLHGLPRLDLLHLDTLDPAHQSIAATKLPVQFPSSSVPRGLESWYLLRALEEGRRYEVRICWPATQPTDFWLDTYDINHVLDTPSLASSLTKYNDGRRSLGSKEVRYSTAESLASESALFLRIQATASYYSSNRTLMEFPPPVDVDIILDPFILNVLPRSLGPTAIYISVVSVGAWFLSGYIYRWLAPIAEEPPSKDHTD